MAPKGTGKTARLKEGTLLFCSSNKAYLFFMPFRKNKCALFRDSQNGFQKANMRRPIAMIFFALVCWLLVGQTN
jgi:hypothetical protein